MPGTGAASSACGRRRSCRSASLASSPANTGLPDAQGLEGDAAQAVNDAMTAHYESLPVHGGVPEMGMAMVGDRSGMGFLHWVKFCAESPGFSVSGVVNFSCNGMLSEGEVAAYDAPFPDESYKAGARQFPSLVPIRPDNPAIPANRAAWKRFEAWGKTLPNRVQRQRPGHRWCA